MPNPSVRRDRWHPDMTLLEPGHVQTREVSPRKRAADRSLHAVRGCFFHSDLAVHRSEPRAGVAAARRAELGLCDGSRWSVAAALSWRRRPSADGERLDWPLRPRPAVMRMFDAPSPNWKRGHRGVDLAGTPGQPVYAAAAGHRGVRRRARGPTAGVDRPSRWAAYQLRAGPGVGAGRSAGRRGHDDRRTAGRTCRLRGARLSALGSDVGSGVAAPTTSIRSAWWRARRSVSSPSARHGGGPGRAPRADARR